MRSHAHPVLQRPTSPRRHIELIDVGSYRRGQLCKSLALRSLCVCANRTACLSFRQPLIHMARWGSSVSSERVSGHAEEQ
jgi:hypothetical protein